MQSIVSPLVIAMLKDFSRYSIQVPGAQHHKQEIPLLKLGQTLLLHMKFSSEMVIVGESGPATPKNMKAMRSRFNKTNLLVDLPDEVLVKDLISFSLAKFCNTFATSAIY